MLCAQCRRVAVRAVARSFPSSSLRQPAAPATPATFSTKSMTSSLLRHTSTKPCTAALHISLSRDVVPRLPSSRAAYSSESTPPPTTTPPAKPDYLDEAESQIWDKLSAELAPTELSVKDISGGCGSMYGIEIASEKFRGANMLKQQRMVNAALGEQIKGWHGVQLRTKVPST
ncbi:BolA-like protein 3 [Microdochium nivale]|nr:BolA-like protein 3 [Microdochium nivale]